MTPTTQTLDSNMFKSGHVLYADELNTLVKRINSIIGDIANIDTTNNDVISKKDIQDEIDKYDKLLKSANSWLTQDLTSAINRISSLENGSISIDADNETIRGLKNDLFSVFVALRLGEYDESTGKFTTSSGTFATTSELDELNQLVGALQSSSTKTQSQVGIIANWYEKVLDDDGDPLLDNDGNEIWVPKYDGAKILATINDSGETGADIIADLIHLDGYVKASDIEAKYIEVEQLGSIENQVKTAVISELNVPTKAEIKEAVITDLEAGNVTITGDLHYNRIIGNTTQVSTNTQLGDNAYFVQVTNDDYNNYITVTLPSNPIAGQTIFIGGTKYYNLAANKQIHVYYREVVSEENYKQYLRTGVINVGESQNAFNAGWEGYVEFIYTGQYWQQLIHNISIA